MIAVSLVNLGMVVGVAVVFYLLGRWTAPGAGRGTHRTNRTHGTDRTDASNGTYVCVGVCGPRGSLAFVGVDGGLYSYPVPGPVGGAFQGAGACCSGGCCVETPPSKQDDEPLLIVGPGGDFATFKYGKAGHGKLPGREAQGYTRRGVRAGVGHA